MSRTYHIGQTVIPYKIDWSQERSTIGLSMDESMTLTVKAPMRATYDEVESVLGEKQGWLLEKLYHLEEGADPQGDREFLSGEKLPYRGRQYPLKVEEADVSEPRLSFDDHTFTLEVHQLDKPSDDVSVRRKRQAVVDWYVSRAKDELVDRVDLYSPKFGASDRPIEVTELERNWGEFQNGTVRLHWRLILAPVRIQDYVVVHELAHYEHEQHSRGFWNAVGSIVPDYESRREWLRLNGRTLSV
ncbi:M48 family metallopeptidase [Halogeometricum sp. S1BR25-6]|uniref:M48 family metallopeptidase n=1 Tax=Halogeometricum salsisoli TaxID=2950536 RepID=A0ABU2GGS9_9EURY|nr:SprT family zinc-dependent metalloprotease [Halogeometricum sp. S1BR25-6]MDS0299364.1 M48 family metallopeptidase [Halogeometricum sp. S1BR25-6]